MNKSIINKRYHTVVDLIKDREEGRKTVDNILAHPNKAENERIVVYFDDEEDAYVVLSNISFAAEVKYMYSWDEVFAFLQDFV